MVFFHAIIPKSALNLVLKPIKRDQMFSTAFFHPILVHFPIALILAGFAADVAYLFYKKEVCLMKTGFYLMILGALGALVAFLTGEFLTSHPSEGEVYSIFELHETGAWITLITIWIGVVLRVYLVAAKKEHTSLKWVVFAVYCAAFCAVAVTGHLGGYMVYNYMIGL
jgi:uncharacterized membrane protein